MVVGYNRLLILNSKREKSCRIPIRCLLVIAVSFTAIAILLIFSWMTADNKILSHRNVFIEEKLDFFMADNVTGFDHYIVPNIVHFIHFDKPELDFIEVVCIKAAYLHQKPDKLMIHSNHKNLTGKYWDMVRNIPCLELHYLERPTEIFGKKFSQVFHASDIARTRILKKYGGIYLDSDSYIVQSLDRFRKYEMTLGWPIGQFLGTQVLIAHKDARFLPLYINTYHQYDGSRWYYNAGELPTTSILYKHPEFVHRVPIKFGVETKLIYMLYNENSSRWKEFYALHLLIRHRSYMVPNDYIKNFDENNIKTYNKTFGQMARLVMYGTTDYVK